MIRNDLKILLVEDEIGLAMLMERQLEDLGYRVHTHVTMGQEAVNAAQEIQPDVILMDIRLAGPMDGIEAANQIRGQGKHSRIIYVTGYDDPQTRQRAQETHPLGFFTKPLDADKIAPLLEDL